MPNVHHESQYCETGLPDRSTAEDYRWKDGPVDQVGWMLDQLDNRGSFLRRHLARMCYAWATLALVQEATPYMFASLRDEFALSVTDLGVFAASFQLGCVAGAALSVASLDTYGRHCSALVALAACVVCSTLSAIAWKSFAAVVVLRVLQSCAWSVSLCLNTSTLSALSANSLVNSFSHTVLGHLCPPRHTGLWHRHPWQHGTPSSFLLRAGVHSWQRTQLVGRSVGSLLLPCLAQASHGEPCTCSWPSLLECSNYCYTQKLRRRGILPSVGNMWKLAKYSSAYFLSMGKF